MLHRALNFFLVFVCAVSLGSSAPIEWTMLDVSHPYQADAHLLKLPDGSYFLIDSGEREPDRLLSKLQSLNVKAIGKVFISHPHKDHYQGLTEKLVKVIQVQKVYLNLPDQETCAKEQPGCDWEHFNSFIAVWKKHGIAIESVPNRATHYEKDGVTLKTLYSFQGKVGPKGHLTINDTSLVMRLTYGKMSALFTGDLNLQIGSYLADTANDYESTLLKVPHHGTATLAPNRFFDKVKAQSAFVPAPESLWKEDRSRQAREYFQAHNTPTYISGIHGDVLTKIYEDHYEVFPQRSGSRVSLLLKKWFGW